MCVVSSVGGHLREVLELLPVLRPYSLSLVLNDRAEVQLDPSWTVHYIAHAERDARVLWNVVEAQTILRRDRPDVILSAGAGPAVPLSLVGQRYGAEVIYIETFGSVEQPSLTGRLLYPMTRHFFYQWPALRRFFPRGRYEGPVFARQDGVVPLEDRRGVLLTVGTSNRPMERLLRWVDALCEDGRLAGEPVTAQIGLSPYRPRSFTASAFMPAPQLDEALQKARLVICHAGAGALGQCIRQGQRPVVVPRRARFDEAVNDHQRMLARALESHGHARVCEEELDFAAAVQDALARPVLPAPFSPAGGGLLNAVDAILRRLAAERGCVVPA